MDSTTSIIMFAEFTNDQVCLVEVCPFKLVCLGYARCELLVIKIISGSKHSSDHRLQDYFVFVGSHGIHLLIQMQINVCGYLSSYYI